MSLRVLEVRTTLHRIVAQRLSDEYRAHLAERAEAGDGCA